MKKISDLTIEQLRNVTPDEILSHGVIERAPDFKPYQGGYRGICCPLCGSGGGRNHPNGRGTNGAGTVDADGRFYCHACRNESVGGHKLSPIDLFAIHANIQNESFSKICAAMANEFGISCDVTEIEDLPPIRSRRSKNFVAKIEPPVDRRENEMIAADLAPDDDKLRDFLRFQRDNKWRGLPFEILQRHGCKIVENWTSPTARLQGKFATATARMLIPSSRRGYLARLIPPLKNFDEREQKYIVEKQHAGEKDLFNADALNSAEPVFCAEAYIDAMSIELAGFNAVALGGVGNGFLVVNAVAKMERKPRIIILLDSDESGRNHAPKLREELIGTGCACVVRFLSNEESKIDANQILVESGEDELRGRLQTIFDDSLAELDAIANELEKEKSAELDVDLLNSLFDGDSSDLDFARRFEKFFGNHVRWQRDDEKWLTFDGGVWTRGGSENSCLLPFARQVADTMSRHAANADETKLAEKLKSTRKILSSITMMKSCDSILCTAADLDAHDELLNVLNGVVDLQTGKLLQAAPELLLTQQCRADYDSRAQSAIVDDFFTSIQPDEQTRRGLLRWLGYCLCGEVREERFGILVGVGKNGKGVLSNTMLALCGSYGCGLPPRSLLRNNRQSDANNATTALNALEGARFAICEELPSDSEIDAALIKNLTGGDKINLRRNFCEYRTVENHAKVNLSGNYLPKLECVNDDGLLRRLLNFPFNTRFGTPEHPADPLLKKKLIQPENLRGLLALLVRECVAWYKDGLIISPLMKQETARHLSQNDFVSDFVADNYILRADATIKAKDFLDELRREYPRECSRFKRADLIKLVSAVDGISYGTDSHNCRVFRGVGKLGNLDSEPVADVPFD